MNAMYRPAILILLVAAALGGMLTAYLWTGPADPRIAQAEASYRQGEMAKTIAERAAAFNKALSLLLQLESEYAPQYGSGRLYYDIGNTYYQLEQYPWAVLYYARAENLMPRDEAIQRNLALARRQLNIPEPSRGNVFNELLFHTPVALPEYLQLFAIAGVATLLLLSLWIWTRRKWCKNITLIAGTTTTMLLLYLALVHYLSPVEAVLVHAAEIRRGPGLAFAKVGDVPVPAGTIVEVIGTDVDEGWVKVAVPGSDFGYAPQDSARLISAL